MTFDDAVIQLAEADGATFVVTQIPGVWEEASEYYNNDAIDKGGDFDDAVIELAEEDGAEFVVTQIPGVWEEVSEYYNNEALRLTREGNPKKRKTNSGMLEIPVTHLEPGHVLMVPDATGRLRACTVKKVTWDKRLARVVFSNCSEIMTTNKEAWVEVLESSGPEANPKVAVSNGRKLKSKLLR